MSAVRKLSDQVTLPCGVVVPNRIVKAALTEGLAGGDNHANERFVRLYRRWGEGGAGMLITGNVIVDRTHLERGGNLAIDGAQSNEALSSLAAMAQAAKAHGSLIVMQLNHAGRQTQKMINKHPLAPSNIGLKMGNGRFATPTPMTADYIEKTIEAFVHAALIAEQTGFDGIQVHAGHGYLTSQFLSPLSNRRTDEWGGSLENRARFLIEIIRRIRARARKSFIVAVKLNSADFQRGGFSEDDSATVAGWLQEAGLDFIEVSGGNYEQPRMINFDRKDPLAANKRESTMRREAYFLDFVPKLRKHVSIPVMVTGGFRSAEAMERAVGEDGVDFVGLGRPIALDPDAPKKLCPAR
ncbi:MAG: NADH:flavin oxidoreductase/NADH oxidase family protein [Phyllobacteriaceae bacterium]|nr:NADH:flavin oxidoreductase/NADH oxidase family protein [Phyllobacteriaceae bacterium]